VYRHTGDYAYAKRQQGDYAYQGDPGFPFIGAVLRGALPILKKVGGGLVRGVGGLVRRRGLQRAAAGAAVTTAAAAVGTRIGRGRAGREDGKPRRRMNVTNVKALRRAIRRSRGFVKIARKTVGVFGLSVQRRGGLKRKR